jgi:hypothetical protein
VIVTSQQAPPSRRWLAHLVQAAGSEENRCEPLEAAPSFSTEEVLELACRERVAPLIHLGLIHHGIGDALPESFQGGCEAEYYGTLRRNIVALKTGNRILDAFRFANVAAAPIDAWALLQGPFRYYADNGARPLEQLEVVIRELDIERAEAILVDLGYRRTLRVDAAHRSGHERTFERSEGGSDLLVELRWGWEGFASPASRVSVSGDAFLDHLCDTTVSGYYRPTRVANLVVASVRAARNQLGRWAWLSDVHRTISACPVDWDEILASARKWRVRAPLYASLVGARDLFGTRVPREALDRLAPGPLRRHLLHRSLATRHWQGRTSRAGQLLLGESWWEVARAAARSAVPRGPSLPGWGV